MGRLATERPDYDIELTYVFDASPSAVYRALVDLADLGRKAWEMMLPNLAAVVGRRPGAG